jgi:hypothetical protein
MQPFVESVGHSIQQIDSVSLKNQSLTCSNV